MVYQGKCPPGQKFDINLISNCTLPSNNGKHILIIGDSQTGHLKPLLNKLHNDDGYGIKFYSSAGINFPSLIETRSKVKNRVKNPDVFKLKYKKSIDHFNYYFSQLKKGDIIILSSRYELRWGDRPIPKRQQNVKFTFYDSRNKILSKMNLTKDGKLF